MRLLLFVLMLAGCTDVNHIADTAVIYKKDVKISEGGTEHYGVAVLPAKSRYELSLTFAGQLDLFTFRSCHREVTQEDAGGGKIFGKKNQVSFTYAPVDIEALKTCPVTIEGHEAEKGRHSWAYIDFETPLETLPAVAVCNGTRKQYRGVSICQSLSGLIQRIIFTKKVTAYSTDGCPTALTTNGEVFDIIVGRGVCEYSFRAIEEPRDFHRHTTLGYDEIMVRKEL